jgi:hypothetical protein
MSQSEAEQTAMALNLSAAIAAKRQQSSVPTQFSALQKKGYRREGVSNSFTSPEGTPEMRCVCFVNKTKGTAFIRETCWNCRTGQTNCMRSSSLIDNVAPSACEFCEMSDATARDCSRITVEECTKSLALSFHPSRKGSQWRISKIAAD